MEWIQCVASTAYLQPCRRSAGLRWPEFFQPMCWQHRREIEYDMLSIYLRDPYRPQVEYEPGLCLAYVNPGRDDGLWHLRCGRATIPNTDFCPFHARGLMRGFMRSFESYALHTTSWGRYEADRWGVPARTALPSLAELAALL